MTLALLSAAALVGIAFAGLRPVSIAPVVLASCVAALAACLTQARWRTVSMLVCAAALGAARGSVATAELPATGSAALAPLREAAQHRIVGYLPEPHASLAAGVLLGGSGHLDAGFKQDLQRSGLGHLVAIDGFKQVLVAASVGGVATRLLGPRLALVPVLSVVGAYTLLTGAHPSAVRAALMVALAGLARLSGRIADPLTSLCLALLAMAMLEPRVLFDLGLQLSLSATLGIVLLWPMLRRKLRLYRLPRVLAEPIGLSLAVTLGCLPLTLSVFGLVSLISPLAHVLAIPLLPLILLATAALALAAPIPALATAIAWLVWLPDALLVAIVRLSASLPGAAVATGHLSNVQAAALALGLLGLGVWHMPECREARLRWSGWRRRNSELRRALVVFGGLGLLAVSLQVLRPDGRLHVDALELSRGQAALVRAPNGATIAVVLGRADAVALATQVAARVPVWQHYLDAVVTLDPAATRAVGPTLARYPGTRLIAADPPLSLELGGAQFVQISTTTEGQLSVEATTTSAQTTSAARPESAD